MKSSKGKNTGGVSRPKKSGPRASGVAVRSVAKKRPSPSARSRKENPAMASRHAFYKEILKALEDDPCDKCGGFCSFISYHTSRKHELNRLPELIAEAPTRKANMYWWPRRNWEVRKKALRAAIKASAPATAIGGKPKAVPERKRRTERTASAGKRGSVSARKSPKTKSSR